MCSYTVILKTAFAPKMPVSGWTLISFFQNNTEDKFNGDLISLPLPQDAPPEIPRFIMNSSNGAWKLEVSVERINIIFNKPLNLSVEEPTLYEFSSYARNVFKSFNIKKDVKIQRLALITERVAKIKEKAPSQFIADNFCKDEYLVKPFNNTKGFEIHSLKNYTHAGFDMNSWVRIKSANLQDDKKSPVILAINDLNTFSYYEAPDVSFSPTDIEGFFNKMPDHLESILGLYFKS